MELQPDSVDVAVVRVISCDFFGMTSKRSVLESASSVRLMVSLVLDLATFVQSPFSDPVRKLHQITCLRFHGNY